MSGFSTYPADAAPWWGQAVVALSRADPILADIIARYPGEYLAGRGDPFVTLVRAVVSQQVSTHAAQAIWTRIQQVAPMTPHGVAAADPDALGQAGLTRAKQRYVQAIARAFLDGSLDPDAWDAMPDADVDAALRRVPGIGPWTAQMFLMFHLKRPDILPLGDVGLLRAVERFYGVPRGEAARVAEPWAPWRTAATWFLWRALDPQPIGY